MESTIGAHLLNSIKGTQVELYYWREKNHEVDFVLKNGDFVTAIEVKSSSKKESLPGMGQFAGKFEPNRLLVVGDQGISLEEFLTAPLGSWVKV